MTPKLLDQSPAQALEREIEEHLGEVARLRARYGDPDEALAAFMRTTFDLDALQQTYLEYLENRSDWLEEPDASPDGR